MPNKYNTLPTDGQNSDGRELNIIELKIAQIAPVRAYVRAHTIHSWAVNDCHRFALADFLIQHQRRRADAVLELKE